MVDAAVVGAAVGRPLTKAEENDVLVLAPPHNPEDAWLVVWEELAPFLLYPTGLGVAGVVAGLVVVAGVFGVGVVGVVVAGVFGLED
jgi:hypothetical protein